MAWTDFFQDFGKFLLTGILSFAASSYYTELRMDPGRNVSLVPLSISIEHPQFCVVDRNKLKDASKQLGSAGATFSSTLTYESYLNALVAQVSARDGSGSQVNKRIVPGELLPRLEKEGILNCNQQQDTRYSTFTLQTAALLDQPTVYILKRSCRLFYGDEEIPIRASAGAGGGVTEPEMLTIRESSNLIFYYDKRQPDKVNHPRFNKLLEEAGDKPVELRVECFVISPNEDKPIGGQRPYSVNVLSS
jgi:hypothetical protein